MTAAVTRRKPPLALIRVLNPVMRPSCGPRCTAWSTTP